jgi:RHS repeat-associated protein
LPEWKTPAQLAAWSEALHQKALAKEAAQAAASRPSTVDASTSSLNSGVPTPLAPPQGSGAARSSQSNQLPPVAGFYTGKPYLAESGCYAFKYREYNPEMNRWTTVDPSGFPDGANNRLYAAAPTSQFDALGTIVCDVLNYNITTRAFTINDINGNSLSYNMTSGDNKPANQNIINGGGPIPVGDYNVYTYKNGGAFDNIGGVNYGAFILDPNDSNPQNDGWDNGPASGRYSFRLHCGSSSGCITTQNGSVFNAIYNDLMSTIDTSVGATTITSTWNNTHDVFQNEGFIGTLRVTE